MHGQQNIKQNEQPPLVLLRKEDSTMTYENFISCN
jgi:hypothetical protein